MSSQPKTATRPFNTSGTQHPQTQSALAAQPGVYLSGLPEHATENVLEAVFGIYAPVSSIQIMPKLIHGQRAAFVNFQTDAADQVLAAFPNQLINIQGVPVSIQSKRHPDTSSSSVHQQQQPHEQVYNHSQRSSNASSAHLPRASSPFTAAAAQNTPGWAAAVASLGAAARATSAATAAAATMQPVPASQPLAATTAAAAAADTSSVLDLSPPFRHPQEYQPPTTPATTPTVPIPEAVAGSSRAPVDPRQLLSMLQSRGAAAASAAAAGALRESSSSSRPVPRTPPGFPPEPSFQTHVSSGVRPDQGLAQHFRPIPFHFQQQQQQQQQQQPQHPPSPFFQMLPPTPFPGTAVPAAEAVSLPTPYGNNHPPAAAAPPPAAPTVPSSFQERPPPPVQLFPSGPHPMAYPPRHPFAHAPPPSSLADRDAARIITDLEQLKRAYHTLSHCLLCGAASRSVVLMPCKHLALCEDCSRQMQADAADAAEREAPGWIGQLEGEQYRSNWQGPAAAAHAGGMAAEGVDHEHTGPNRGCRGICPLCGARVEEHIGGVRLPGA